MNKNINSTYSLVEQWSGKMFSVFNALQNMVGWIQIEYEWKYNKKKVDLGHAKKTSIYCYC